jgi:phosphopentomutase
LGKDTPSGHWEMMGVPVLFDWGYFPDVAECFPPELIQELVVQAGLPGVLGNCHASGTTIIEQWGEEHLKTGKPIVYTSADSVFQIAAHEETFGLQRLYEVCEIARKLVDKYQVGRVIARPFVGKVGAFKRTANRKDYTTPPHRDTLLDVLKSHGHQVIAIGKIADIFAHKGISQVIFAEDNHQLFEATMKAMQTAEPGSLVFTNFVDFDSKYGHRRDVQGYAKALEDFDVQLQQFEQQLQADDLIFIVADHGCDPTQPGSDHTREYIPVIMYGKQVTPGFIGKRDSFSDVGQTIATFFDVPAMSDGTSFLHQ